MGETQCVCTIFPARASMGETGAIAVNPKAKRCAATRALGVECKLELRRAFYSSSRRSQQPSSRRTNAIVGCLQYGDQFMSVEEFWLKLLWGYLQQRKSKSSGKENSRKPNVKMKSAPTTTLAHDSLHREQERIAKGRWQKFFSDPSQWWDHRFEKQNAKYPDFKHKETQESLWIIGRSTPAWVKAELAAIPPGTLQLSAFSWNTMIARYVKDGKPKKAIGAFQEMQEAGIKPDKFTFCQVLKACADSRALEVGLNIHGQIAQIGCESDIFVGSCLIDMYSKCGSIEDACRVFNNMPTRNVVSWNTIIAGYLRCGQGKNAVKLFQEMLQNRVEPDRITFMGVLKACANTASLEDGRHLHAQAIISGLVTDPFVVSCLIDMYGKCNSIEDACQLFNNLRTEDVVIWCSMIMKYVKCGQGDKALRLYEQMQLEQVVLDSITSVGIISACASISAIEDGRKVHAQVIKSQIVSGVIGSCLVDMYGKCGFIEDASRVFNCMLRPDAVSWNTMILAYVNCGQSENAIELFYQMQRESVDPDKVTFMGILKACANLAAVDEGRYVHTQILQSGYELDVFMGSSLIDMYSKFGDIEDALKAFEKVKVHNVFSWSAIINAFVTCGQGEKALDLFESMQREGVEPNNVTFVGVLNACANLLALKKGQKIHKQVAESSYHLDLSVGSSLIDMYSKCGSIEDARRVFDQIPAHDTVSCTIMLGGYAMHGLVKQGIQLFEQMCRDLFTLDNKSLVYLLSACSHAGYVNEGHYYFDSMTPVYGISLTVEHYGCIVDLLGRTGHLAEAEVLINNMSCQPTISIWMALLGACRMAGNLEIGKRIARKVLALQPENASGYVLLSNIYAAAGKWDSRTNVQQFRNERHIYKEYGRSWIELEDKVHTFSANDTEHPQMVEIHTELNKLLQAIEKAGYVPEKSLVLHDVEEEASINSMAYHSEKLALVYGLISTPPGTPLRIFKNLRICRDCHSATKFISKIIKRPFIMRDANRFHHFEGGVCTCSDYW